MSPEQFEIVSNELIEKCKKVLNKKNKEYARGNDKLSNFKKAAGLRVTTQEDALMGMAIKHTVSIDDFVKDISNGIDHPIELWEEKLIDQINYMLLLYGMIQERYINDLTNYSSKGNVITAYVVNPAGEHVQTQNIHWKGVPT